MKLQVFRDKSHGLSDLLPYAFFVEESIIVNKDGSLTIGFYYQGNDLDSSTASSLEDLSDKINQNLLKFGNGWCFHIDVIRKKAVPYPSLNECYFTSATAFVIDEERRASFNNSNFFENVYTFVLTFLPNYELDGFLSLLYKTKSSNYNEIFEENLKQFKWNIDTFVSNLHSYLKFVKMSSVELARHINVCITGEYNNITLPEDCFMYLDVLLATRDVENTTSGIKIGGKFVKVLTINGYPDYARADTLSELSKRGFEYRWNTRFIPIDKKDAHKHLKKIRRFWRIMATGLQNMIRKNPNPDEWVDNASVGMKQDIENAMSENSGSEVRYGFYSTQILIFGDSQAILEERAKDIIGVLDGQGFAVRIETFHSIENYLGSLPANAVSNVDNVLVNTINLSHLMSSTSIWCGSHYHPSKMYPDKSPALVYAITTGNTPFRLNIHVNDVGHFLVLGPTSSGKSTLLGLIASSQFKYSNARVFCFDMKWSMLPLCYALNGIHYDLVSDQSQLSLCPLADLDNEQDIIWAYEYIQLLFELKDVKINSTQAKEVREAINILAHKTPYDRSLSQLKSNIQDKQLTEVLNEYVKLGVILDGKTDLITTKRLTVFEMYELTNLTSKSVLIPAVLIYLFRRLEKEFKTGEPTVLILDEVWAFLKLPIFAERLIKWIKVARSFNVAVGFATQNLSDIDDSDLSNIIKENCLTKIYLPNHEARNEGVVDYYRRFGLNEQQIHLIASSIRQRHYYYASQSGNRMFELNLKQVQWQFLARTSINDAHEARRIYKEDPEMFAYNWLKSAKVDESLRQNLDKWAEHWLEYKNANQAHANT